MNEGKGLMIKLVLSYKNKAVSRSFVRDYCEKNNWCCDFGKGIEVLIYPKILKRW